MSIFRKVALDRLSSPEQLDQLMRVTSPRSWLALAGLACLIVVGLVWSVVAVIPTNLDGSGVVTVSGASGNAIEAVLFVSVADGRRIAPGMPAKIALAPFPKEQFGMIVGRVTMVGDTPLDLSALTSVVGNDAYAQSLAATGALIDVRVALEADPTSQSGYRWSIQGGPASNLRPGMLADGMITISEERPIALIVP